MFHLREFAWFTVTCVIVSIHPASAQSPAKPADAKAIAALIAQLGDEDFQKRQAATRSLEAIGRPALAALREAAAKNGNAEVSRRAKGLLEKIENGLEQLLEDYKSYGLPLPPKDAPLVRFESGGGFLLNGVMQPKEYALGFLLKPESKNGAAIVLRGTYRPYTEPPFVPIDPVKAAQHQIDGWVKDAKYDLLPLAIQCKSRGWEVLAKQLHGDFLSCFFGGHRKAYRAGPAAKSKTPGSP